MKSLVFQDNTVKPAYDSKKRFSTETAKLPESKTTEKILIRFEEKKDHCIWVSPDEIVFVVSADHYVKSLIKCRDQLKWVSRHCTIKQLLATLSKDNFIRLNKFYLLNQNYFSHIDEHKKILYLCNNFSIPILHRISPYISDILKPFNNYT